MSLMQIYLPIAELPVNVFVILAMGLAVGFLSGMFGVGGGFLMTPLLIFLGIPPAVAVGTQSTQVVASSVTGALAHWRISASWWRLVTGSARRCSSAGSSARLPVSRYSVF